MLRPTSQTAPQASPGGGEPGVRHGAPHPDAISRIVEMGFGRGEVVKAMQAAHDDSDRAVEYLMEGIPGDPTEAASIPDGQGEAAS